MERKIDRATLARLGFVTGANPLDVLDQADFSDGTATKRKTKTTRPKRKRTAPTGEESSSLPPALDEVECETIEISDRARTILSQVAAQKAELAPAAEFPAGFEADGNEDDTCKVCRLDCGADAGFNIMTEIEEYIDAMLLKVPTAKLYRVATARFNAFVRSMNPKLAAIGEKTYEEWTYEDVRRHFDSHNTNLRRMLLAQMRKMEAKQAYTHRCRTYYTQKMAAQGRVDMTSDLRFEMLWLRQSHGLQNIAKLLMSMEEPQGKRAQKSGTTAGGHTDVGALVASRRSADTGGVDVGKLDNNAPVSSPRDDGGAPSSHHFVTRSLIPLTRSGPAADLFSDR